MSHLCPLWKTLVRWFKFQYVTTHKQHWQNCIHTNQAHQFYTAPFYYSSNSNPCLLSCSLSFRLLYLPTLRLPSISAKKKLQKVQNTAARLVCKAKKSDQISSQFFKGCIGHQWHTVINIKSQPSASIPALAHLLSICLISYNYTLQPENYVLHLTPVPSSSLV